MRPSEPLPPANSTEYDDMDVDAPAMPLRTSDDTPVTEPTVSDVDDDTSPDTTSVVDD